MTTESLRSSVNNGYTSEQPKPRRWIQTLVTLLSSFFGNVLIVIGTALLSRMLGGEEFGSAVLVTSAAITLGSVTSSGICLQIVRTTALGLSNEEVRIQTWIGTLLGQSIAGLITIILLIKGITQDERPLFQFIMIGLTLHFTTLDALSKNRLIGAQRLMHLAGSSIVGSVCSVSLQFVGAWIDGTSGYIIGFAAGTGLQALSSWLACRSALFPMGYWPKNIFQRLRERNLLEFITLATFSACIGPLAHWFNSLIAAHKMNSYVEVSLLTVAMQFFNMVIFVPAILNKVILPNTIKYDKNRNVNDSRLEARRQAWKMFLYTAPMLPLVWMLSGPINSIYQFHSSEGIVVILSFVGASVLACAAIPLSNYFISHSKMNLGLMGNLLWAITYVGLGWLVPGGAIGVAISLLTAYALNFLLVFYLVNWSHNTQKLQL